MKKIKHRLKRFHKEGGVAFYGSTVVVVVLAFIALTYVAIPILFPVEYSSADADKASVLNTSSKLQATHLPTPMPLKGIYMSQCVSGTPSFRARLVDLIDTSDLNAVVIDIKDYTGRISFKTGNPVLKDSVSSACGASDMKDFVKLLHEKGIYVIGRVTVFQDPYYTKLHPEQAVQSKSRPGTPWKDYKGLSFIDVSSKEYWSHVVALSKESHEIGFDEINYDYIRYPSDGPMSDAVYVNPNKAEALEQFFMYLNQNVKPSGVVMSADLFGMTTTNDDDLNIGQVLERALPYFDYIAPMVYPSHYPSGFIGLSNPNSDPYKVVNHSLLRAVERTVATTTINAALAEIPIASTSPRLYAKPSYNPNKIRPWLQDFNYGGTYGPQQIQDQIRATTDAGLHSWVFWDAGNRYSGLSETLLTLSRAQ